MINIIFSPFTFNSKDSIAEIRDNLANAPYSEADGWGFEDVSSTTDTVSAKLIKRSATYIFNYDPASKEMVKRQIDLFAEIRFELDVRYQLLYVFGQANYVPQLRSALRRTFENSFALTQSELSPYQIFTMLTEIGISFEIRSMSVERFVYENGISGKLLGTVINNDIAVGLMERYKNDVNKVLFNITGKEAPDIVIQASNHGVIKFFCEPDDLVDQLEQFKNILYTKPNY